MSTTLLCHRCGARHKLIGVARRSGAGKVWCVECFRAAYQPPARGTLALERRAHPRMDLAAPFDLTDLPAQ